MIHWHVSLIFLARRIYKFHTETFWTCVDKYPLVSTTLKYPWSASLNTACISYLSHWYWNQGSLLILVYIMNHYRQRLKHYLNNDNCGDVLIYVSDFSSVYIVMASLGCIHDRISTNSPWSRGTIWGRRSESPFDLIIACCRQIKQRKKRTYR